MKKTCVFLAVILLLVLVVYACEMPHSIELKTDNFKINAPIKADFSLASILSKALKDSFPEDFIIYDMINYPNAQAFLIAYQIDIMDSFNPDDYLKDIEMPGGQHIEKKITISKMETPSIEEKWFFLDMSGFFDDVESQINTSAVIQETSAHVTHRSGYPSFGTSNGLVMGALANIPSFTIFDMQNGAPDFDSVFVHTGKIVLDIWLEFDSAPDSNLTVELTGIDLRESVSPYDRIGNQNAPLTATITSSNTAANKHNVTITIDGEEIKKNNLPQFHLGGITSKYTGNGPASDVGYTLYIQPRLSGITLSGVRNLKIAETEEDLPDEIADEMTMASVADLINAEIASGELKITANPPQFQNRSTTGCNGMTIGYKLTIEQDPVQTFQGLNGTFTETNTSLAGKTISGASLSVDKDNSKIIIKTGANGITFNLSNESFLDNDGITHNPFYDKVLPVKLGMGIDIKELTVVRWNSDILPSIDSPEINFADMNVPFIEEITFDWIELNVNLTKLPTELKDKIAMRIDCSELGFNDINKILKNGANIIKSNSEATLNMSNTNTVELTAKLIPVIGGTTALNSTYIEVGPVIMGDDDIEMDIEAEISVEFQWKSAKIDVSAALEEMDDEVMGGTIPEEDEEPIDLSEFKKYMEGITFSENLKAKIFLSGMPDGIVNEIKPQLTLKAQWENGGNKTISGEQPLKGGIELPLLPKEINGKWVYTDTVLPQDDGLELTGFDEIIAAFPENLRFTYNLDLNDGSITINRNDFEGVKGDGRIKALLVLLLPLELKVVGEDGGFLKIPGLFEDNEDLFGRKNPHDESIFTGLNIKSLRMKIDFEHSFFAGASLHFGDLFGENGRFLGDGNSLSITFTEEEHKFINDHLIIPDVKFAFPKGRKLQIARNFLPIRIVITASGSYTLDFEDIGDLFGSGN